MLEQADTEQGSRRTESQRSAEEIRKDIDQKKEVISDAVNRLSQRIHEKVDWRGQIKKHPGLALGVAAGAGFLVSGLLKRRPSPLEEVAEALHTISARNNRQQGLIGMTLLGIASKVAIDWMNTRFKPSRSDKPELFQ